MSGSSERHGSPFRLNPERPMLWTALLGTGLSVLCYYCRFLLFPLALLCALLIAASFLRVFSIRAAVVFLLLFLLLCNMRYAFSTEDIIAYNNGRVIHTAVEVIDEPAVHEKVSAVTVRLIDESELPRGTRLRMTYTDAELTPGDRLHAKLRISTLLPDNRASYFSDRIYGRCRLRSHGEIEHPDTPRSAVQRLRERIRSSLLRFLPRDAAMIAKALLIGDRTDLSEKLTDGVRGAGVSHVLVVSGLHFSILVGGAFQLIEHLLFRRVPRFICAVAVVIFFCALCGFTVSVLRAGITFIIASGAYLVGRDNDPVSALGAAVVLILLRSPFAVFDVSFQLSVLSTAGVLIWFPAVWNRVAPYFAELPITSAILQSYLLTLCAMFLTLPVTAWHFGILPLSAPLTNLLISLPVTVALLCAALGLLLLQLPFGELLAPVLFFPVRYCLAWFMSVVLLLGTNPCTQLAIPKTVALPASAAIVLTALLIRYRKKYPRKEHYHEHSEGGCPPP